MYELKPWKKPNSNEVRLYVHGTTRQSIYFTHTDYGIKWSSKAKDTPFKYQTGDHYGKIRKDEKAAVEVAEAFKIKLGGDEAEWLRLLEIVKDGISVGGDEE